MTWTKALLFLPVLVCLAIASAASIGALRTHFAVAALQSGKVSAVETAERMLVSPRVEHSAEWIETAKTLASQSARHDALAINVLEKALEADASHPDAWALLSFLHTRRAGRFTEGSGRALQTSFDLCGYCSADLLRWRFTYVLRHWSDVSEASRLAAFSGADFLRWWYLEYEFLEEVRAQADANGIPFDAYRKKVGTHVRPNEV